MADITPGKLRDLADLKLMRAEHVMATALAIEDDEMSIEDAKEFLNAESDLEIVRSDHYPGDEYFDRASMELHG